MASLPEAGGGGVVRGRLTRVTACSWAFRYRSIMVSVRVPSWSVPHRSTVAAPSFRAPMGCVVSGIWMELRIHRYTPTTRASRTRRMPSKKLQTTVLFSAFRRLGRFGWRRAAGGIVLLVWLPLVSAGGGGNGPGPESPHCMREWQVRVPSPALGRVVLPDDRSCFGNYAHPGHSGCHSWRKVEILPGGAGGTSSSGAPGASSSRS